MGALAAVAYSAAVYSAAAYSAVKALQILKTFLAL